ncbi:MAG TPA: hypothetical protein VEM40_12875 [Nitrospirota bacterium]|nr:hypothetical protein [Nitrospirota bacterium]
MPLIQKLILTTIALAVGLLIGLGFGQMQIGKEQKICQEKMREKDKKIAFMMTKLNEEKAQAASTTSTIEQRCRDDVNKLQDELVTEKKKTETYSGRARTLKEQVQKLDDRITAADEAAAKTKQELQETLRSNKELGGELRKAAGEEQALQSEIKKIARELGTCSSDNAELVLIAKELVKKYKDKGFGSVLLEKEPLTQIRKVELDKLTSQYQEEIDQKKFTAK